MSFDDRRAAGGRSGLTGIYTEYVGEPEDRTTVYGYWLYVVAYGLGLLAIVAFVAGSELLPGRPFLVREVAIAMGGLAGLLLLLGIVLQMPIRPGGRYVALVGTVVALIGLGLFVSAYPRNWAGGPADQTTTVLVAYGAGLAVLIGVVAFAPLATSKRSLLFTAEGGRESGGETGAGSGPGASSAEGTAGEAGEPGAEGEAGEESTTAASTGRTESTAVAEPPSSPAPALQSAAESLFRGGAGEGALFALYEEAPDGWDWRLVHQSVVAENDRRYGGRDDAESAVATLRTLVEDAGLLELRDVAFRIYRTGESWRWVLARHDGTALAEGRRYDDRGDAEAAVALAKQHGPTAETVQAGTAFTLRETGEGWTWEFVDSEDETLAATPRRFEDEPGAESDVERVRGLSADARLLDLEEGGFELRETDGEWRWRFVTPEDTPLVESEGAFESRDAAEADAELATCPPEEFAVVHADAAAFEVYERGEEWRWRLAGPTGDLAATAPGPFDARGPAESSARTVQGVAADAPVVELDDATFETYPEGEGEEAIWRWRLVDDERTVLAESTHPYDTAEAAETAAEDVRAQVGEADLIEFDTAAFQLYESETEWRWRLIERDGKVVADSGEDYRTKEDAAAAIPRLKEHVPNAELIEVENTAFELFRDDDGWGWRLIDETGHDLATATERHPTRRGARRALETVTSLGADADAHRFEESTFQIHAVEAATDGGEDGREGTGDRTGSSSHEAAGEDPDTDPRPAIRRVEEPADEGTSDPAESAAVPGADAEAAEATGGTDETREAAEAEDGSRWAWVLVEPSGEVLARGDGTHRSRDAAVTAVEDLQSYAGTAPVNVLGELTARVRERGSAWTFDVVDVDREVRGRSARRYDDSAAATEAAGQYGESADGATRFTIDRAAFRVEDADEGGHTWRLVDPDRRPLVAAAERFDTREDAIEALTRFRRDAAEAPVRDRGVPVYDLERVEDGWRWRLLDGDRELIARAGESHPTREAAEAAMAEAREAVAEASVLELEGAAFELFETDDGAWRWRLVDEDGRPLATSFRAHESREAARRAMSTVKEYAPDAPQVTVERPEPEAEAGTEA
ncbi:MAG: YegP family protein [Haloarculaceae archaeon]